MRKKITFKNVSDVFVKNISITRKHLIAILIIALTSFNFGLIQAATYKKTNTSVYGKIVDVKTQETLPYVVVSLNGTTIGTTTDGKGNFFLKNLPSGNFTLIAKYMGYKTVKKNISLNKGKKLKVNLALQKAPISLDGVVVSANRNETNRQLAPTLVSVVDIKMLEATNSKNMAQALNFQPGLRVEDNCQNCGFTQVRINGLEGAYSQILIDSRPTYGALTGVYGLDQIPTNMIEQVEVIRGGGSALFGSSAIGGVINIITKEPTRNTGTFSHSFTTYGEGSTDNNSMFNASMVSDNRKAGIMLYGQNRDRNGYDHDGDDFTEMPMLKNRSFGFRSFLKTSNYSKLTLEYHNMHEFRRGGDNLDKQPFQTGITEQLEHFINGGGLNYAYTTPNLKNKFNVYASAQHTLRKSYYGGGDPVVLGDTLKVGVAPTPKEIEDINNYIKNTNGRLGMFGRSTELMAHTGGQYTRNFDNLLFLPAELTAGTEYSYNALTDISGYRDDNIDQTTNTVSAFLQNEWKNDMWSILLGGRLDKHSLVKNAIFSPRANLRFNPNGKMNFRLSYSEGFRAPQYFDEDLHIALAGGEPIIRVLSEDLEEERSRSISGSIDSYFNIGDIAVNTLVEGFFTTLYNTFTESPKEETINGNTIKKVINAKGKDGRAKVYGVTFEARMAHSTNFDLQTGLTLQKSLFDEAQEVFEGVEKYKEFMRTPNIYGYFVATWKPIKKFSAIVSGKYTGSMYVPHEADPINTPAINKVDDFFELGTKVSYEIPIYGLSSITLSAGVDNIFNAYQEDFDKGKDRDSAYIYGPATPRSYFISAAINL